MEPRYQHQETANEHLWNNDVFALIMEQGTGKSRPILDDWVRRVYAGLAQDLVIFAPKGCYLNWIIGNEDNPSEIDRWLPGGFVFTAAPWISGANTKQTLALARLLHATVPRILVMNIEALNLPKSPARKYLLEFLAKRKVIGVVDESTTIAHESAKRTKYLLFEVAHRFVTRRILSGLVAPESAMDLYTQYHYLDPRIIGLPSFITFMRRYAEIEMVDYRPMHLRDSNRFKLVPKILSYKNLDELNQKIMAKSYRVTKDEVLDLPPKIYKFWDVELDEDQRKIYRQMRDIATAQLKEGLYSTASMKLDQLGKLQHILCGHVRNEDGTLTDIPETRTDAIIEILHGHAGKAIIWCPWPQALRKIRDRLCEEFGEDSTVGYWGETKLEDRVIARDRIMNDDACRFIVSNQSVGKFGNTWTSCNLVIYYANSFDNEDRQQSEDRAHRIGQTKSVTYIDLRAKGTIDEKLIHVLRKKINMASTLVGDEFRTWLI